MTDPTLPDPEEDERLIDCAAALVNGAETSTDIANRVGVQPATARGWVGRLRDHGFELEYDQSKQAYQIEHEDRLREAAQLAETADQDEGDGDPFEYADPEDPGATEEREELTPREDYIYRLLPASVGEIAEDLEIAEPVVEAHLAVIAQKGWAVERNDESYLGPDLDHLRSSEHKQTRTKKANRWWQARHDELVHEFRELDRPTSTLDATSGSEDWVLHLTDLHAGDRVRRDDGTVVYSTDEIPDVIDYVTEQALSLADKHGSDYDTAHLLWGGDFITNEGIYEGQFEHLDAWLDEQHATLVAPLLRQLKAFADRFPTVQVVCQVGNHGNHRASGTSQQANADLILYKHLRNTVAAIREHGDDDVFGNVNWLIGEAAAYRNFPLRGGDLTGHLRHGQNRKPQAETSARSNEWRGTVMDHEFDVAAVGHHHISGRIPWDGPPVIFSGSPKPTGELVERIGGRAFKETEDTHYRDIATSFGMSDDGVTSIFPIDTRYY